MFPYVHLGPLVIQAPLLAVLAGLLIGLWLSDRESVRLSLDNDRVNTLVFVGLLAGVAAARLGYAARYASAYWASPLSLLSPNVSALSPLAGVLGGILAAAVYGRRARLPLRLTLDALAPGLAFFMLMLAAAHLLDGSAYGAPARLPWAVYLWGDYRHPSQVYEIVFALAIFAAISTRMLAPALPGWNMIQFVALSAAARLFLEAFRGDSTLLPGGVRLAQLASLAVLAACSLVLQLWKSAPAGGG